MSEYKSQKDAMKDGTFAEFYNGNPKSPKGSFLKVKQALGIGRVLFAFVEKGTNGKGVDIYVKADAFDNFCDDILSGVMRKELAESKSDFPDVWEYITGEKGSKHVKFGKGKSAECVFQGYDANAKKNIFVSMDYAELRTMAKWWRRVSKRYYEECVEVCLSAKPYNVNEDDLAEPTPGTATSSNAPAEENEKKDNYVELDLFSKADCKERQTKPGDFAMACVDAKGNVFNVVFPAEIIKKSFKEEAWLKFVERSTDRKTPLQFKGKFEKTEEKGKPVFRFVSFSK